jgi:ABC-2 type transport system permease protein
MSTLAVAKKEFNDAVRSKVLLGLTALFLVFAGGTALLYAQYIAGEVGRDVTTAGLILTLWSGIQSIYFGQSFGLGLSPVHVFVPFVGLLLGYRSIVKERESGQIKLLLSLPHSRADVVFGKLLGRSTVGVFAALSGFILAVVIGIVMYQEFAPLEFAGFVLATLVFLFVYVGIGIAISSASPSTPFAIAGGAIYMVIFHALWGLFFQLGSIVLDIDTGGPYGGPEWFIFLREINPARAYNHLVVLFVSNESPPFQPTVSQNASVFLQDWFFLFVMLFWLVVPLGVGYALFEYADL